MIALVVLLGSFVMVTAAIPLAALIHRSAQERQVALSLAQYEMEFLLTNPGPAIGGSGNQTNFANAAQFPGHYTGSYLGQAFAGGGTLVIVRVSPPRGPQVEISALDTN
jgi:hypothetical protein